MSVQSSLVPTKLLTQALGSQKFKKSIEPNGSYAKFLQPALDPNSSSQNRSAHKAGMIVLAIFLSLITLGFAGFLIKKVIQVYSDRKSAIDIKVQVIVERLGFEGFERRLEEWASAPGQQPDEQRAIAKERMLEHYRTCSAAVCHYLLDLSYLGLTTLPPEIGALPGITYLDLRSNQLTSLPPEIGALTGLTELNLSSNQLISLPREIGALSGLTRLDLSFNRLTSLSREIGVHIGLTRLDLSSNQLTSLPSEIGALTRLTRLDLESNRLTSLPREIGALIGLASLDLKSNRLASLPPEIGALTRLTHLELESNRLTTLPPEIGALTGLTYLDLKSNRLASLPPEIGACTELCILDLSDNELSVFPESFLVSFPRMIEVDAPGFYGIRVRRNRFTPAYAATLRALIDTHRAEGRVVPRIDFDVYDAAPAAGGAGARIDAAGRAILSLPEALNFWELAAKNSPHSADFWQPLLDCENAAELAAFLTRQRNTANFKNGTNEEKEFFAKQLVSVLCDMVGDETFRDKAFEEIGHSNTSCDDREAYGCDKLMIAREIYLGLKDKSDLEVAAFAVGLARKTMVEEEAAKIPGDQIETALRMQIVLKDLLKLPTITTRMLYAGVASVDEGGAVLIGSLILEQTRTKGDIAKILSSQEFWQERLRGYDDEGRYIAVAEEVSNAAYESEDVRKAEMMRRLDELYLADTDKWLDAHYEELKVLVT